MMKCVIVALSLIVVALASSPPAAGPSYPVVALTSCDTEGKFAADSHNMCWYHQCVLTSYGQLTWMPRRCAWGSIMSTNYVEGLTNPCMVNLEATALYNPNSCKRVAAAAEAVPACFPSTCQNGGTPVHEGDVCWCECPAEWQGDFDCSRPTMPVYGLPAGSNICVDGAAQDDWCYNAGGCLNGGTCFNQCDTFWCDCGEVNALSADHIGKRCEIAAPKASYYHPY